VQIDLFLYDFICAFALCTFGFYHFYYLSHQGLRIPATNKSVLFAFLSPSTDFQLQPLAKLTRSSAVAETARRFVTEYFTKSLKVTQIIRNDTVE